MNTHLGLIGKKLGNTQIFNEDGLVTRVTAVQVGPCVVLGKRTIARDGYSALILGFGEKREKLVNKPDAGQYTETADGQGGTREATLKSADGKPVRHVREFRVDEETAGKFEAGQVLKPSDVFEEGMIVDVSGTSKGRGFSGVMKRHNFAGAATATHGTHEYKRHGGSIGTNMTPGRVLPGVKMAGQYGNERVTMLNIKLAKVLDDENIVLLAGGVPGSRNGIVTVRGAVKTKRAKSA